MPQHISCTLHMHFTPSELQLQHVITCTLQMEILWCCTTVPLNTFYYTPQIASYRCCIALPCDVTCTVQNENHQCCSTVHWHVTFTVQTVNHQFCAAVVHNVTCTLQFAGRQCSMAMPYHRANCKSSLLHCSNIRQKWNEILIPAVSLLQSGLTASDVFNVGM